jgi:hypothetical protein
LAADYLLDRRLQCHAIKAADSTIARLNFSGTNTVQRENAYR